MRPALAKGRIYDALHSLGSGTNADIQAKSGYSHATIAKTLHELVAEGAVTVLPGDMPNQPWLYTTSDVWIDPTPVVESDTPDPVETPTQVRRRGTLPAWVGERIGLAGLVAQLGVK